MENYLNLLQNSSRIKFISIILYKKNYLRKTILYTHVLSLLLLWLFPYGTILTVFITERLIFSIYLEIVSILCTIFNNSEINMYYMFTIYSMCSYFIMKVDAFYLSSRKHSFHFKTRGNFINYHYIFYNLSKNLSTITCFKNVSQF